jgi:hypothetical protein
LAENTFSDSPYLGNPQEDLPAPGQPVPAVGQLSQAPAGADDVTAKAENAFFTRVDPHLEHFVGMSESVLINISIPCPHLPQLYS